VAIFFFKSLQMPELPDVTIYIESLEAKLKGQRLETIRFASPFLLRSVSPTLPDLQGKQVLGFERIGKRIVFALEAELFIVLHLMIAGRLHWKNPGAKIPGKVGLAAFDFSNGSLLLTEAGTKKRASLHFVQGQEGLMEFDRGGLEVFEATVDEFRGALLRENHTVKRTLTDPRLFGGIGNAYSDEILHRAKLSPLKQTKVLTGDEVDRLYAATRETLQEWIDRLRGEVVDGFPGKVTAFRKEMSVHGKFGQPCPVCGSKVQRIVYAENECNYCARCQTGGKLLSDRSLSRLLKADWPKTIDELEAGGR
jgi:formamidopyrimidine-DNA glycosylase